MIERLIAAVGGVELSVKEAGSGVDVVFLSSGPGCVQYLADDRLIPLGVKAWFPEPRGVGRSGGGPHSMADAIRDLETIRQSIEVERWAVVGHSWGSDLAVRYAVEHPETVTQVVGIAGHGLHDDRTWDAAYHAGKDTESAIDIPSDSDVWRSLTSSFEEWIHAPTLWQSLADGSVSMTFIAAGGDIRPPWPLQQLSALVPNGRLVTVSGVPHHFWFTHPSLWVDVIGAALSDISRRARVQHPVLKETRVR